MRKLFSQSIILLLFGIIFVSGPVRAQDDIKVIDETLIESNKASLDLLTKIVTDNLKKMTQQLAVLTAQSDRQATAIGTANNQSRALGTQQSINAQNNIDRNGLPGAFCQLGTSTKANLDALSNAKNTKDVLVQDSFDFAKGKAGGLSENGNADAFRRVYEEYWLNACSQSENGSDNVNCTAGEGAPTTLSSLLNTPNLTPEEAKDLAAGVIALSTVALVPMKLSSSVLENPNTDQRRHIVNRYRLETGTELVANTYANAIAQNAANSDTSVQTASFIKQKVQDIPANLREMYAPDTMGQYSPFAMRKIGVLSMNNPRYLEQKVIVNEESRETAKMEIAVMQLNIMDEMLDRISNMELIAAKSLELELEDYNNTKIGPTARSHNSN